MIINQLNLFPTIQDHSFPNLVDIIYSHYLFDISTVK